jgi:hypothetical protein
MKKILLLAAMLISARLFAVELNVGQGVSFIRETTFQDNKAKLIGKKNYILLSNTRLGLESQFINAKSEVKLGDGYRSIYFNVNPKYDINKNLSFLANISYTYYNVEFSKYKFSITENNVTMNVGIELRESLFDFINFRLSAFVGYVPVYSNCFYNLCETKFNIDISISKYVDIYFNIESFQNSINVCTFNPLFVKNGYGIRAHYDIGNLTIFASWDYYCLHPENAWWYNDTKYNRYEDYATIGLTYKF